MDGILYLLNLAGEALLKAQSDIERLNAQIAELQKQLSETTTG